MCDMGVALGMMSNENGDQSYVGFDSLTPSGWYDGWVSAIYTWTFWDYLSQVGAGVDPNYTVEQAALLTAYTIQLDWIASGYPWALPLEYCLAVIELSEPALGAKLRDHL